MKDMVTAPWSLFLPYLLPPSLTPRLPLCLSFPLLFPFSLSSPSARPSPPPPSPSLPYIRYPSLTLCSLPHLLLSSSLSPRPSYLSLFVGREALLWLRRPQHCRLQIKKRRSCFSTPLTPHEPAEGKETFSHKQTGGLRSVHLWRTCVMLHALPHALWLCCWLFVSE